MYSMIVGSRFVWIAMVVSGGVLQVSK